MSTKKQTPVPEGYMQDHQGKLTPLELVKEIDIARDELVKEIVAEALDLSKKLGEFKAKVMQNVQGFIDESGKKYQVKMGGNKGNVTLMSYDGKFKVMRAVAEHIVFDERLQVAKELIDECIHEWSEGSRSEIRALVNDAFQVDKEGRVSTYRILGLQRLDIKDRKWKKAMTAIKDSMQVAGSKSYIRIYERVGISDQYVQIPLDVAAAN